MKKNKLLALLLVVSGGIGLTSCETEPVDPVLNNNNGNNQEQASFEVDFNGETFVASNAVAVMGNGTISLGGFNTSTGQEFGIVIDGTAVGPYSEDALLMSYTPDAGSEYTYSNMNITEGLSSGEVTITEIDTENHTISGTFSFTGWWGDEEANVPPIEFTNGVFESVPYTGNNPIPTEEYFVATLDDEEIDYSNDLMVTTADGGTGETITLHAQGEDHSISLYLSAGLTAGNYVFSDEIMADVSAGFEDAEGIEYDITGGQLIITSNENGWMEATFEFLVKDDTGETIHTLTGGSFNVHWDL